MNADIKTLEFDKVLNNIKNYAVSDLAKEAVLNLYPSNDSNTIMKLLDKTDEALVLIYKLGDAPLGNIYNIYPHLKRVEIDGVLSSKEIREISMHLLAVSNNKQFLLRAKSENIETVFYKQQVDQLVYIKELYQNINRCIDEDSNILDSASFELARIRSKIKSAQSKVEEKLQSIKSKNSIMLTDGIITRRNDRFVVPVKLEYKNKFKGIIQDYSSSGETVFIEPQAVVELTNKIQILKNEEKKEIEKILIELSEEIKLYVFDLRNNLNILVDIDVTFAKAKFGRGFDCTKPLVGKELELIQARHPLLPKDEVVPNDIHFNQYKVIIITGPNTGGKTVALKTLGLLSIMAQSGILIPVKEGSKIIIFDNIFADIGDEQSIEQSLSTFSSHMKNIIRITDLLTTDSLVLLDELGSGTDPKEGASLAISILEYIKARGTYIMATTHYPELKAYAYNNIDVVNASTKFDIDTLSPTYKLSIGIPGRSNAFEISRRLGLNNKIIDNAINHVDINNTEISILINKLEDQSRYLEDKINLHEEEREKLIRTESEIQSKVESFEKDNLKLKNIAKEEAKNIIEQAKKESQKIIDNLLNYKEEVKLHKLIEQKSALNKLSDQFNKEKKVSTRKHEFSIGDKVKVLSYGQTATITKVLPKNNFEVKMGILTTTVHNKDLEFIEKKRKKKTKSIITYHGKKNVRLELDLRGYRFEDAMIELEKYIDNLIVSKVKSASIIHGHGTNALKFGVQEFLKNNKYIKNYRYGKGGEGGSGVTVIEIN
ncbi:endonuclease MutS2 [Mycoplasmatota bacterium zrk1]